MSNQNAWHSLAEICHGADAHFLVQCDNLEAVQQEFLRGLLAENAETEFGRKHDFATISSYEEYAAHVRISLYDGFTPYIKAIISGERKQLTGAPPLFAEMTGGSTSGEKIIPYTQSGLDDYWSAIRAWLADLMQQRRIRQGRIYFALSPVGRSGIEKIGTLPLGSPKSFAYFGSAASDLEELSVAPAELSTLTDFDAWSFATCVYLLSARDLALIWVWSPTYLTELVRAMKRFKPALIDTIASGAPTLYEDTLSTVSFPPRDPARANALEPYIGDEKIDTRAIWPVLDTISCWMDASSKPFAAELKSLFPDVWFQAKGLMMTEGAVTVPFGDGLGSPLAVESGFFEFVAGDRVYPAWDVERGKTYRVLVSNRFGLYRYDTADLVEIVGFTKNTPRLAFKGRAGLTTDLCGEKLTEEFVLSCIQDASDGTAGFAILAASSKPRPHYVICAGIQEDKSQLIAFAEKLEHRLRRNPQYAYARDIGQLSPLEIRLTDRLFEKYRGWAISEGRNLAGLKAPALLPELPAQLQSALNVQE